MKNAEVITTEELAEEIITILKDEIVATFSKEDDAVKIKFLNGQSFMLTIKEVK